LDVNQFISVQKIFIACVLLFLFSLESEAQKIPLEQRIIKEIIELRNFFISKQFDQEVTLKNSPSWEKGTCDCSEPPPTIEEMRETTVLETAVEKPKKVYKDQYPKYVMFHKKDIIGLVLSYDAQQRICLTSVYQKDEKDLKNINSIITFLKKKAIQVTENEYLYLGNYFRIDESIDASRAGGIKILTKETYPQGFENRILVR
jgi:hypothetical protein